LLIAATHARWAKLSPLEAIVYGPQPHSIDKIEAAAKADPEAAARVLDRHFALNALPFPTTHGHPGQVITRLSIAAVMIPGYNGRTFDQFYEEMQQTSPEHVPADWYPGKFEKEELSWPPITYQR
jgi:hypothetical protein